MKKYLLEKVTCGYPQSFFSSFIYLSCRHDNLPVDHIRFRAVQAEVDSADAHEHDGHVGEAADGVQGARGDGALYHGGHVTPQDAQLAISFNDLRN